MRKLLDKFYKPVMVLGSIFFGISGLLNLIGILSSPSWLSGLIIFGLSFSLLTNVIINK